MRIIGPVLAAVLAIIVLAASTLYTVDQRQHAIVFQLGEVKDVVTKPGLHFKWPLLQNVRVFDMRILTFDDAEPLRFITSEKKPVLVDSFVKWRILDVKQFYVSVQGDEFRAATRLKQTISGGLQNEFNKRTVHEVVSGEREKIMEEVRDKADQELRRDLGVEIVDVRLKRVDLPQEVSESVYRRMEAERKRIANELRSTGSAEGERIRADADRQREVVLAEAKSAAIYAGAFLQNPEFFAFMRSMEAYKSSFRSKSDVLVMEPNSDFFRYLRDATGKAPGRK
jgi:membrane protease subunit HflC